VDGKVDVRETAKNSDARGIKNGSTQDAIQSAIAVKEVTPKELGRERMIRMLDPAVLGSLTIDIVAQLGRGMMTIDELAHLGTGEVVRLDTPLNGVIDLTLNGALVARGEIVAVDDQFGIRITEILVRPQ
jgi:flagellar motor switch protein FliN/FliY